jgi:hypothetical protein
MSSHALQRVRTLRTLARTSSASGGPDVGVTRPVAAESEVDDNIVLAKVIFDIALRVGEESSRDTLQSPVIRSTVLPFGCENEHGPDRQC